MATATAAAVAPQVEPTRERHLAPAPAPAPAQSLSSVVAEAISSAPEADPHVTVERLVRELSPDLLAEAARHGLAQLALKAISGERNKASRSNPGGLSGKWEAAAEHRDVLALRLWTGAEWKFLRDCTKVDLEGAERVNRTQAAGLIANADRYAVLARKMRKGETVADLKLSAVEALFNA